MWSRRRATANFLCLTSVLTKGRAGDVAVCAGRWHAVNLTGFRDQRVRASFPTDETSGPVGSVSPVYDGVHPACVCGAH